MGCISPVFLHWWKSLANISTGPNSIHRVKYQGAQLSSRVRVYEAHWHAGDHKPSHIYYDRTVFKFIKRWFLCNIHCLEGPSFFYKGIVYQECMQNLKGYISQLLFAHFVGEKESSQTYRGPKQHPVDPRGCTASEKNTHLWCCMLQMKVGNRTHFSHPPSTSCNGARVPGERRQGCNRPLQHSTGTPRKGAHKPSL